MPAVGKITRVLDRRLTQSFRKTNFPTSITPSPLNTLYSGNTVKLTGEVQQHLGAAGPRCGPRNHRLAP